MEYDPIKYGPKKYGPKKYGPKEKWVIPRFSGGQQVKQIPWILSSEASCCRDER
ncbi:hypothetical protein KNP414_06124 [Paenibacillus mucilaginosus KNP414]|uniref:Uncharacterized protein n=1 Tax=Paenibacillus mucilaginosus (strain KNP414) TaxID=1036673 RepID=F8FGI8_PAEMK|nr:hypothetical protein KNP414_06124 [Paenibacillus mucilaginosus KNP414]